MREITPKKASAKKIGFCVYSLKKLSSAPNQPNTSIASIIMKLTQEDIQENLYFVLSYFCDLAYFSAS